LVLIALFVLVSLIAVCHFYLRKVKQMHTGNSV
jgi:hypothetical protein